jgi:hypothetical protein
LKQVFTGSVSSVSPQIGKDRDAFLPSDQIIPTEELDTGSEKPTLQQGRDDSLRKDTEPADFRRRKVFLIRSDDIFWGKGSIISFDGRKTLSTIGSFLKKIPEKVVVSEGDRSDDQEVSNAGLERAWAVGKYLTSKGELDRARLNIAGELMAGPESEGADAESAGSENERWVEICVLERRVCR